MTTTIPLPNEQSATALAVQMAPHLRAGDCLLLSGPVGAGKTHFARAIIQTLLLHPEDVPSPTFTLVQTYDAAIGEIWHADLYRLTHVDELIELGLADAFSTAVTLIEWPDRLGDARPIKCLEMDFSIPDIEADTRELKITATGVWPWLDTVIASGNSHV